MRLPGTLKRTRCCPFRSDGLKTLSYLQEPFLFLKDRILKVWCCYLVPTDRQSVEWIDESFRLWRVSMKVRIPLWIWFVTITKRSMNIITVTLLWVSSRKDIANGDLCHFDAVWVELEFHRIWNTLRSLYACFLNNVWHNKRKRKHQTTTWVFQWGKSTLMRPLLVVDS